MGNTIKKVFFSFLFEKNILKIRYILKKNTTFAHRSSDELIFSVRYIIYKLTKTLRTMAYVISNDCIACGTCIDECPSGAISAGDIYSIDPDACTECGTCADVCPNEAISL